MATANSSIPVVRIPWGDIRPGPWQPRKRFDADALKELAESLKTQGVLTPLRVVRDAEGVGYLIVAGERRWRASEIAGITELPCMVLDSQAGEPTLRGLAILDNLHRANLRPGEESRAVAELDRLGIRARDIGKALGKSEAWVGQRLVIARLPDAAIDRLDGGSITIEEARMLTKLLEFPELLDDCLQADGSRLKDRLRAHVPESLGERVLAVRRFLELERQRELWATRMRSSGQRVLDEKPRDGDRRFMKLVQGSELSRAHQEAGLSCESWAWENGRPVRYCDNRAALKLAARGLKTNVPSDQSAQAELHETLEREAARDVVIGAWLATSRGLDAWELTLLAHERINFLTSSDDRCLARLGGWLGELGDRADRVTAARRELETASDRRLIQLWFLLEAAQSVSYSVIPTWIEPLLKRLGFDDPRQTRGLDNV